MKASAMLAAIAMFAGCEQVDIFVTAAKDEGTVYECRLAGDTIVEYCYLDDAADELGDMISGSCGTPNRRWPRFTNFFSLGCAYTCPGKRGCNALHSCFCP